jgi:hypothetical protein
MGFDASYADDLLLSYTHVGQGLANRNLSKEKGNSNCYGWHCHLTITAMATGDEVKWHAVCASWWSLEAL